MRNLVLVIEYDGTDFHGFADQPGVRTVQGTLKDTLQRLLQEEVQLYGAARTDAGVHAHGQVVNFYTAHPIPVERLPIALNRLLPSDLKVKRAFPAAPEFHARFSAKSRVYQYTLYTKTHPSVWQLRYAYHAPHPLDIEAIRRGASELQGTHDFRAFCTEPPGERSTIRHLYRVEVCQSQTFIRFIFEGNAFLRGMVRLLVGSLIQIGRGQRPPDFIRVLLTSETARASYMMPPQGLCLIRVKY